MLATVFMMEQRRAEMSFGKRGVEHGLMSKPAFATAVPEAPAANMGNKPGLFAGSHSDDFDIDLSYMQPYGYGKSVIMLVLWWLLLGTMGGHRFYLGHWLIAFAMFSLGAVGIVLIMVYLQQMIQLLEGSGIATPTPIVWYMLLVVAAVQTIWWFIDGVYVFCRKLSA